MHCFNWTSLFIVAFGIYVAYKHLNLKHKFEYFNVPPAHKIDKSLPKLIIKDYELLLHGKIKGIESLDIVGDTIYATDHHNCDALKIKDNKIVQRFPLIKNKKCGVDKTQGIGFDDSCCAALGIRHWYDDKVVFVDGVLGVLVLDYKNESVQHIYSATNLLGKYPRMFANDFDFINNETIVFSDSTSSCSLSELGTCIFGAVKDSRLIQLNLKTREPKILLDDQFAFNGVQTHSDKQSVLVAQCLMSQIIRYYFDGPKKAKQKYLRMDCLDYQIILGYPGKIQLNIVEKIIFSKGNTFWVTHFLSRSADSRIVGQILGPYPGLREWFYSFTQAIFPRLFDLILSAGSTFHHIFVELDKNGKWISFIHDKEGKFRFITQITDNGSHLYLSSIAHDYVAKIEKVFD